MKKAMLDLLGSKRALIALATAGADILILTGLPIDPTAAVRLATAISTISGILIAAYSVSETGSKAELPAGKDVE